MTDGFRRSMAWLHSWTGLVLGWMLYFMFLTGTAGYVDSEIDRWMRPELPPPAETVPAPQALDAALVHLLRHAPRADQWYIMLPQGREEPWLRVMWHSAADGHGEALLDADSGAPLRARATGGGQFLYQMHWRLHYLPQGVADWLVGVAAMVMLVALITGVIVHKKIFADLFTFRPGKGQRSWLDAHDMAAVLALPFHLMITYSGLLFTAYLYLAPVIAAAYGPGDDGRRAFFDEAQAQAQESETARVHAPLASLSLPLAAVEARWGTGAVAHLDIRRPGDAHARVGFHRVGNGPLRSGATMVFDGVSGALLAETPEIGSMPKAAIDVLLGLHEGLFAGPLLRGLYVASGLLGTAMIGTGLVLWCVKRRGPKGGGRSHAVIERLNIGTIIGLPIAIAAYFWSNRLIPAGLDDRPVWEAHVLFATWMLLLLHAAVRPTRRAWVEQLRLASAAFLLLPALNALTTERHLGASLMLDDWAMAGFDLTMLAVGLVFAGASTLVTGRLRRDPRPGKERRNA